MFGRLAMGFANVRAGTRVLMLVLVQAKDVYNKHGVRGFYRGLGPALLGGGMYYGLCFTLADVVQSSLPRRNDGTGEPVARQCPFRVLACAARTLNATGQSRVTLSLRQEHLRAVCGPCQEERSLTSALKKRSSQAMYAMTAAVYSSRISQVITCARALPRLPHAHGPARHAQRARGHTV